MSGRTEDTEATAKRSRVDSADGATTGETAENEAKVFISFLNRMVEYACENGGVQNPRVHKQEFSTTVYEKIPSHLGNPNGAEKCVLDLKYEKGKWKVSIVNSFTQCIVFRVYRDMFVSTDSNKYTISWHGVSMEVSKDEWGMYFEISSTEVDREVLQKKLQTIIRDAFYRVQFPDRLETLLLTSQQ